jgi:hydroxymethylglutaryl-CoA reductase (NADPH)
MMFVPNALLKQLYTFGSLENTDEGISFSIKNRLANASLIELQSVKINGKEMHPHQLHINLGNGQKYATHQINAENPVDFPLRKSINIACSAESLPKGKHKIGLTFRVKPFGKLKFEVEDEVDKPKEKSLKIPRDESNDYNKNIIELRQKFIENQSHSHLNHLKQYSFEPMLVRGNCENFTGVAQVPMGFAGPLKINGEHAKGEFYIPLATTEGTLVASYNRGMQAINLSGGVKTTILEDAMQRAPVFIFENALASRDFAKWLDMNFLEIASVAESTSSIAKLLNIEHYLASKMAFLRFNFSTGDAAGQNMVTKATMNACNWILQTYAEHPIQHFYLESNFATDKKSSHINMLKTRGKRVVAECVFKKEVLIGFLRASPENLAYHGHIANIGSFFSGANNNGLHAANAIAAMFIATGQDVANLAESSAGILHSELTPEKDLYLSITLPSLIVATYGGGTSLPTQKECLEVMDCYGTGKVHKLAEIIAGVVLAGEISLASAISSSDWVESHEKMGRNK